MPLSVAAAHPQMGVAYTHGSPSRLLQTLAIASNGSLYVWGGNSFKQLGDGTSVAAATPKAISPGANWTAIATHTDISCGILSNYTLWCDSPLFSSWWWPPYLLERTEAHARPSKRAPARPRRCWGTGAYPASALPQKAVFTTCGTNADALTVGVGADHVCLLTTTGSVMCWGSNAFSQVGNNATVTKTAPILVSPDIDWAALSVGSYHTCALKVNGSLSCWGKGADYALGTNRTANAVVPTRINGTWTSVSCGDKHTCATDAAGLLWCW